MHFAQLGDKVKTKNNKQNKMVLQKKRKENTFFFSQNWFSKGEIEKTKQRCLLLQGAGHAGGAVAAGQYLVRAEAEQHVHHHAGVVRPARCAPPQVQGCAVVSADLHLPPHQQAHDSSGDCCLCLLHVLAACALCMCWLHMTGLMANKQPCWLLPGTCNVVCRCETSQ